MGRFKAEITRLRTADAGSGFANAEVARRVFLELERVINGGLDASNFRGGTIPASAITGLPPTASTSAPPDGCWVVFSPTTTEEDWQYNTPCLVLNDDLEIADDTDILITD